MRQPEGNDRRKAGEAVLAALGMEADGIAATANDLAPGFGDFLVEAAFGTILRRPGLDLRTREIVTVGILTALGFAQTPLRIHIRGALRAGANQTEIIETIVQTCLYAGIPAALNALARAKEEFALISSGNPAPVSDE